MGSNAIGEIPVVITGDFSKLDDALNDSIIAAELGGQKLASALIRGAEGADQLGISLNDIASSAQAASMSAQEFASGLDKLIDEKFGATTAQEAAQALEANAEAQRSAAAAAHALDEALGPMPASFTEMSAAQQRSVEHLNEVSQAFQTADAGGSKLITTLLGFAGITLTFAGLKTALTEAFAAFDRVDDATTALTALTGSAKNAVANIEQIRALAQTDALSFPALLKADQNMVAFGIDTAKVPGLLQAAADSAAVTGRSFDSAAQALERIVASGNAGGRQLVSLGLTMKDLASVMGVAETQASKMFKALDEVARVEVVTEALAKFKGLAEATTQDAGGAFQRFRNVVDQELQAVGKALDGTEQGILHSSENVVRSLGEMSLSVIQVGKDFASMSGAVETALVGISVAVTKNPWAAAGLEIIRLGLSLKQLQMDTAAAGEASDKAAKQVLLMAGQMQVLFGPFPEYNLKFQQLLSSFEKTGDVTEFNLKTRELLASFRELHPVVSQVTDTHKSFTSAVQELKKELDANIITEDVYRQRIHDLIASYGNLTDAVKTHSNVMHSINESYKEWADTLTHLGQSYGNIFEAIEKTSAAAGNSRMTFIPLNEQVKAFIDYTRSMAASATDTGHTITVLTGHLTDVDKTLPHLGTSISVTTVKMDEFGHVTNASADAAKKFVDASSSMAAQLQAGMTVITGHASATRDLNSVLTDAGVKLSTVSGGTDTLNAALHALFAPTTQTTTNVQQFAVSLGTADTAANLLTTDLSPLEQRLAALDGGFARAANSARGFAQVLSDDLLAGTLGAGSTGGLSGGTGGRGGGRGGASLFDPNNPSAGGISLSNGALSIVIPGSSVQVPTHHSSAGAEPTAPIGGILGGIDFGMLATGIPTALTQATPAAQQFVNAVDAVTQTFADASSAMITSATAVAATVNLPPPSEFAAGSTFATPSAAKVPTPLSVLAPSQWQRGTVNIYNPTVTNQTQLDQMLTQLQNSGLNTR